MQIMFQMEVARKERRMFNQAISEAGEVAHDRRLGHRLGAPVLDDL